MRQAIGIEKLWRIFKIDIPRERKNQNIGFQNSIRKITRRVVLNDSIPA